MEIQGTIIACSAIASGISKATGAVWRKVSAVLQTDGQYPKHLAFDLFNDKIDSYYIKVGDEIKLTFDINAKEYNGKWYNDIRVINIERIDALPRQSYAELQAAQREQLQQQLRPTMPLDMLVKAKKEPVGQVVPPPAQQQRHANTAPAQQQLPLDTNIDDLPF